ncbi:hypothetical protein B9Q01_07575 [Candidatus Marsarchaeota G1 archaeon OSP_D]|uniref:PD-(D/E)XK endonuclease-like domain-containing protein n=4 Tax=Candidatus Marsarchaeota TaxID=1978152 RepID=A0A2R6C2M1_9ARCH|nr:MAG: hypothetical protein B9Q01_07575 [Candidatus Marsarchaeota G1 archaeon OSP_D]PSN84701.1 MAG: hypothetical protein B9Q02_09135 [Candidatus Marsarchaeota G1 archaeon BE_D]PSN87616.1 MAG: hypothetical protein B9Q00_08340 [Candidatus Marsarchaeota G1 archaeon OSP_C]PSO05141.1 MAG: hypothetical protein B9Q12_01055 [Candidatus Marsarchaeota G2 archaeon ECH_B_SAG-G06]
MGALWLVQTFNERSIFDVEALLKEYLLEEDAEKNVKHPRRIGVYWPSQVWDCLRKVYYEYTLKEPATEETIRFGALGNVLHEYVARILKSVSEKYGGYTVQNEVEVKIEHPNLDGVTISGRVDDLILIEWSKEKDAPKHSKILIEVKTLAKLSSKENHNLPRFEHICQLNTYLSLYPDAQGILLYISRSNLDTRVFTLEFDKQLYEKTLKRVEEVHRYLSSGVLPPAEAKISKNERWRCMHCQYAEVCKSS